MDLVLSALGTFAVVISRVVLWQETRRTLKAAG
jgi:hypothetical protein